VGSGRLILIPFKKSLLREERVDIYTFHRALCEVYREA